MLDERNYQNQLERTRLLRKAADICADSDMIDFTVFRQTHQGKTWRCLFGVYRDLTDTPPPPMIDALSIHFGCTEHESKILFGSDESLPRRRMLIDAHIDELSSKIEDENHSISVAA